MVAWLVRIRPAQIMAASVTAITPGSPVRVQVALQYSQGQRPLSVVVQVAGQGCQGSTTIPGRSLRVEVPLDGSPSPDLAVTTIACYRHLWSTRLIEQHFV